MKKMKLPRTISPCPIKEAVAEIRFQSKVPDEAVFGIAYQALAPEFQNPEAFPVTILPTEIRNQQNLQFQAHYKLSSATRTALIGPKMIAVGLLGEYPGWPKLSADFKTILLKFHKAGIVAETFRFGLRYINFFEFDIYPKLLLKVTKNGTSLDGTETFIKTVLTKDNYSTQLQIGQGMALVAKPEAAGSVIDIDVSTTKVSGSFTDDLEVFLDKAHEIEGRMFFDLLKPEFLQTLNPIYDNEK
jgi:uncharacterized protein (TIGR04255 family)